MPLYAYKGIGPSGKTVSGVKDAESPKSLRQLMRKENVVVTQCDLSKAAKKAAGGGGKGLGKEVNLGDLFARVRKVEVAAFTRQLATLLRAGIPLSESIGALFEQVENVKFKSIIGEVRTAVNEGSSLADALSKHPSVFDDLFCSMVRAGELAGNLDDVLSRLADFMEAAQRLKSKVQGAMIYPIIMIVVGTVIMAVLMIAVVPEITKMFQQQGKSLAWNTRLLIWSADVIGAYWWLMVIGSIVGFILFRMWSKSDSGRPIWHRFILKMPLVGPLARQIAIGRFARTLGTMLSAGVPMLKSLDTAREILGNVILMRVVEEAKQGVQEGESLAVMLRRSGQFPPSITHMIAVGERAGELETMLARIADAYEAEVDMKLGRLTTMLEPLMLVVMGGAVAFVVFSILMPIMDMGSFKR
jgi:general secretion pathway protein F